MKKRNVFILIAAFFAAGLLGGCKNINPGCIDCEDYATLQGTIMDAITGERIGGVATSGPGQEQDIEIYLVQGQTVRKPTSFIGDEEDPLVGEYSFVDVPAGGTHADDSAINEYKLVIIKEGYQRFEAKVSLVDVDNKIGNVYLFPLGYLAPDYTFEVVYNGAPVAGATVYFQPVISANDPALTTSDVLAASDGYLPCLTGETDADGLVTFAGATVTDEDGNVTYPGLAVGAAYRLIVMPIAFEGVTLARYEDAFVRIVGLDWNTAIITLGDLAPGNNQYGLFVTSISNSLQDQVTSSGTLTMVFSRPVTLTGDFGAFEDSPTGVLGLPPVDATLSSDGLTLTLTPSWLTDPGAGEHNTSITYLNGSAFVSVKGYPASEFNVFGPAGLVDANGDLLSPTVFLTTPE